MAAILSRTWCVNCFLVLCPFISFQLPHVSGASLPSNSDVSDSRDLNLEVECELTRNEIARLETALGNLNDGGIMMHRLHETVGFNAARTEDQESSQQSATSACPYEYTSVDLGGNTFPEALLNATCRQMPPSRGCQLGSTNSPDTEGLPPAMTSCQPHFYHVPIIRYHTILIQNEHCVIRDFTVDQVELATGCMCVYVQ